MSLANFLYFLEIKLLNKLGSPLNKIYIINGLGSLYFNLNKYILVDWILLIYLFIFLKEL